MHKVANTVCTQTRVNLLAGLSLRSQGCIASCTGLQSSAAQDCELLPHRNVPNGEVSLELVRILLAKGKVLITNLFNSRKEGRLVQATVHTAIKKFL